MNVTVRCGLVTTVQRANVDTAGEEWWGATVTLMIMSCPCCVVTA